MKFNCGPSISKRIEAADAAKKLWHRKFLWLPVRLDDRRCVWLQNIWRKGTYITLSHFPPAGAWEWEYSEADPDDGKDEGMEIW